MRFLGCGVRQRLEFGVFIAYVFALQTEQERTSYSFD